ncbi:MAG: hypothetical protein AAFY76_02010 [Cyanobacteria bacterium J06649_11]
MLNKRYRKVERSDTITLPQGASFVRLQYILDTYCEISGVNCDIAEGGAERHHHAPAGSQSRPTPVYP